MAHATTALKATEGRILMSAVAVRDRPDSPRQVGRRSPSAPPMALERRNADLGRIPKFTDNFGLPLHDPLTFWGVAATPGNWKHQPLVINLNYAARS